MKDPFQTLWDETFPQGGPCPQADPRAVRRRVNAALAAVPSERKRYLKQQIRYAVILAAVLLALVGSALAVVSRWTVLDAHFGGGNEIGAQLMDGSPRSVSDDNYTLTVSSSLSDGSNVYLTITVEARNETARAALMDPAFLLTNALEFRLLSLGVGWGGGSIAEGERIELATENSRTFDMSFRFRFRILTSLSLRLRAMEEGLSLEIPLSPAKPVIVKIGAEGWGVGSQAHADGGPVLLKQVTITPLTVGLDYSWPEGEGGGKAVLAFLMADGSLRTWGQMITHNSGGSTGPR